MTAAPLFLYVGPTQFWTVVAGVKDLFDDFPIDNFSRAERWIHLSPRDCSD